MSVDSELSLNVRHVSIESRRNSGDSQVSVQIAELKARRKVGRYVNVCKGNLYVILLIVGERQKTQTETRDEEQLEKLTHSQKQVQKRKQHESRFAFPIFERDNRW